jgi:predicted small integral membrane protein
MDQTAAMFGFDWWTQSLGTWMAWTRATAAFFIFIAVCIASMGVWEYFRPGGAPRRGIFALDTTRGDRLFISLLGSALVMIVWLYFFGAPVWWALAISACWFVLVFLTV